MDKLVRRYLMLLFSSLLAISIASASVAFTSIDSPEIVTKSVKVYFVQGQSIFDKSFKDNSLRLDSFFASVDSLIHTSNAVLSDTILVKSSASPEGTTSRNNRLSDLRSVSIVSYITENYPNYANYIYKIISVGEDWEDLSLALRNSSINDADRAIEIISSPYYDISNGSIVGGRKQKLMDYNKGRLWWRLHEDLFPELRSASVTLTFTLVNDSIDIHIDVEEDAPSVANEEIQPEETEEFTISSPQEEAYVDPQIILDNYRLPVAAIKTNLLFDVATLVNLGVEIPVGQHLSFSADAYFPWWKLPSQDITVQMLSGTLEAKYWLGNRELKEKMTGWYTGLYTGAGYYDFQINKGVQGDAFILGGLSLGYSHSISRNLHLDYSLGFGYLRTTFKEYEPAKGTKHGDIKVIVYPWDEKRFSGVVPSKASISLVWLIGNRKGGTR